MAQEIGVVFHWGAVAITLDRCLHVQEVVLHPGAPDGLLVCRVTHDQAKTSAEYLYPWDGPVTTRTRLLTVAGERAYWTEQARRQPFVSLDLESDGARVWDAALVGPDGLPLPGLDGPSADIQVLFAQLSQLAPGSTLVGHNLRAWDLLVLGRRGMELPRQVGIWDTLEHEVELCQEIHRERPSYALDTVHGALSDARRALELAQSQWLRSSPAVPDHVKAAVWEEADGFFLVPSPAWLRHTAFIDPHRCTWDELAAAYASLDGRSIRAELHNVVWHIPAQDSDRASPRPFNPASPKRVEYWHRLLPTVIGASHGRPAILFVQHASEVDPLVAVIPGAYTDADGRRGSRALRAGAGLMVLHERHWQRTLAEGLPAGTMVMIEKAPESPVARPSDDEEGLDPVFAEDDTDEQVVDDTEDLSVEADPEPARSTVPDLTELAKMALWRRQSDVVELLCLDARLWFRRGAAQWVSPHPVARGPIIDRELLHSVGFRQSNGCFELPGGWESDICRMFRQPKLYDFQRRKLERILLRSGLNCEYVERATGGGKSLVFWAAALYRGGETGRLTVVVSPLRALMHDHVQRLHALGFPLDVELLSSDLTRADVEEAYLRIAGGETKLVYCAPERFRSRAFREALETRLSLDEGGQPEFWVFDEAHCISLWGLEFRPDYRKAADYIRESRRLSRTPAPVLLVSATLTRLAKDDIEHALGASPTNRSAARHCRSSSG